MFDSKAHEKGLGSMKTPRSCSIVKVSRALWPSASTTWSARSCSPEASVTPRMCLRSIRMSLTRCPKRISPPAQQYRRASSRPCDQAERADMRLGDEQDLLGRAGLDEFAEHLARQMARVADLAPQLAVENVPAPPSPNCTFDSGLSWP